MYKISGLAAFALLLSACASSQPPQPDAPAHIGIANPASVFCIQQSGKLRMEKNDQGVRTLCILPSGQEVEEWAYFRQHHPASK